MRLHWLHFLRYTTHWRETERKVDEVNWLRIPSGKRSHSDCWNTPTKFNSSPLKNGGWKTSLSYWEGNLSGANWRAVRLPFRVVSLWMASLLVGSFVTLWDVILLILILLIIMGF